MLGDKLSSQTVFTLRAFVKLGELELQFQMVIGVQEAKVKAQVLPNRTLSSSKALYR